MYSNVRRHINATTVVAFIALLFAMSGGAFAINGSKANASTKPERISAATSKSKKKPSKPSKGTPGPRGKEGPAGKEGPVGKEGPAGKEGPTGKEGAAGKEGIGKEGPAGPAGPKGATGPQGLEGKTGYVPFLPEGATETGTWNVSAEGVAESFHIVSLSFPIPLKAEQEGGGSGQGPVIGFAKILFVESGTTPPSHCPGTAYEPKAEAGYLCIYEQEGSEIKYNPPFAPGGTVGSRGATSAGTLLDFETTKASSYADGTWAVTAP